MDKEMMVSPANDDSQTSGGRKTTTTTTTTTNPLRPPEQGLKCPRCDSPNTKFCYYNNYSLTQPRHFCKTCRRYWTKGGALRNVPVGGGCRKNKKSKSPVSARIPLDPTDPITGIPEPGSTLKFLTGPSQPAVDFQLGVLPFSRLQLPSTSGVFGSSSCNQLFSLADLSSATAISPPAVTTASSMVGLNYPISSVGFYGEMGVGPSSIMSSNTHSSIASSIESLSSINQDLHWKLQQQRLAMFFGAEAHKESTLSALPTPLLGKQPEPISFQVPDSTRAEDCGGSGSRNGCVGDTEATAWFFDSSYTMPASATNNSHNNNNNNSGNNNSSNWNGIPAWNDMPQFTTLP